MEELGDLLFSTPADSSSQDMTGTPSPEAPAEFAELALPQERPAHCPPLAILCGAVEPALRLRYALDAARQLTQVEDLTVMLVNGGQVDCYVLGDGGLDLSVAVGASDVDETVAHVLGEAPGLGVIFFGPTGGRWLETGGWLRRGIVLAMPDAESVVEAYRELKSTIVHGAEPPAVFVVGAGEHGQVRRCHGRLARVAERFLAKTIPLAGPGQVGLDDVPGGELYHDDKLTPVFAGVAAELVWPAVRSALN